MPTIHANGIDIYYEQQGSGPRLLYFQGSGQTLKKSGVMVDGFAKQFDVVAHDQRGLGQTEIPPGPYEMADYAADAAALLDAVGWDSCRAFGTSFGGMVAQEFAVTYPDRVERLALACTSPGGKFASYPLHQLADLPPEEAKAMGAQLLDGRFTPEYLAEHADAQGLVDMIAGMQGEEATGEAHRGEMLQLDARSRLDVIDRLGTITCPTLITGGKYDHIAPPENSEKIAELIPQADLRFYEGGHIFFLQDPQAVPDIMEFLAAD
ncbi:MAG TPA: alpha/beta hydrolase [Acidimicrobiia bacterium]